MGWKFKCAIPIAVPHSPPVNVGLVDQDVLVAFLKWQVRVSRRHVLLQGNDNPL